MKRFTIGLATLVAAAAAWTPRVSAADFDGTFESHLTSPSQGQATYRSFRLRLASGSTKSLRFSTGSPMPAMPESRQRLLLLISTSARFTTIRFTNLVRDTTTSSEQYLIWRDSDFLAFGGQGEPRRGANYQTPTCGIVTTINVWGDATYAGEYMTLRIWNDTYQLVWMHTNPNYDIGNGYTLLPSGYLEEAFNLAAHAGYLQVNIPVSSRNSNWRVFHAYSSVGGARR